jgi:ABC-type multidrug transport system fused ATPase/permease subunit
MDSKDIKDKQEDISVGKGFLKRTLMLFKPFWKWLGVMIVILFIIQLIGAFAPFLFGKSVDAVINKDINLTFIYIGIAFAISVFQVQFLSHIKDKIQLTKLDDHIEKAFSIRSLDKVFDFSVGQHVNEHSGVKQSVVSRGQNALMNLVFNIIYTILPMSIQVISTLIILSIFDWQIAFIAFLFIFSYIFLSYRKNVSFYSRIDKIRKSHQAQTKLQTELFRNSTLIISEAQEHKTLSGFKEKWDVVTDLDNKTWLDYLKYFYSHRFLIILGQYVCLSLGVYMILTGKHSTGMFVTLFAWIGAVFGNIIQIMNSQRQMLFQIVEIKKFYDLLDISSDIDKNNEGKILSPFNGEIEFKKVSFAYPYRKGAAEDEEEKTDKKEEQAIANVSLKIEAGAKVGFVGVSGSGKSTIINLMRRYYDPQNGKIFIDGIPLKDLDLRWFRSQVGNVEQKIELFDRSIRENILFGLPEDKKITEEELNKIIKDSSLDEFVVGLKDNGLDTMIGEGGIKVSGGERQRIGIARALIKNPKILIFDEATSALDAYNEKLIHDAINIGSKGRTTIIIAHRLSTVIDADIIFVVDQGKIVGQGKHDELKDTCPEYQKLIKNQVVTI